VFVIRNVHTEIFVQTFAASSLVKFFYVFDLNIITSYGLIK
jgi:hypothetical protein